MARPPPSRPASITPAAGWSSPWTAVVVNHRARRFGRSKYGISRIWKVFLDLLTVKMLLGFTTRPAKWFAVLGVPFLAGTLLALAASAWVHLKGWPGSRYPLVFPAITILCALAWVHLTLVGLFSELVVKVGDFKAAEALLASPVSGGGHESPAAARPA